jgi:hypothetical protein
MLVLKAVVGVEKGTSKNSFLITKLFGIKGQLEQKGQMIFKPQIPNHTSPNSLHNCLFLLTTKLEHKSSFPYFYFNYENHECSRKD